MAKTNTKPISEHPVVKKMKPALLAVYQQVRQQYDGLVHREMDAKYHIGEFVDQIMNEKDKYGTSAVEQLAEALGLSCYTLYDWAKVTRRFESTEFERLRQRTRQGFSIRFTHLIHLAKVNTPSRQKELLERVLKERMTTAALEQEVLKGLTPKSVSGLPRPVTPLAALTTRIKFAKHFFESCEVLDDDVLEQVKTVEAKKVDKLLDLAKVAEEKEQEVVKRAQGNVESLQAIRESLEGRQAEEEAKDRSPTTPPRKRRKKRTVAAA